MTLPPPPALAAENIALFLDFDGTLIPYSAVDILAPRVDPWLPGLLDRLLDRTGGAAAIVSGRGIAEIDALLSPARLAASGTHGSELRLAPDADIEVEYSGDDLERLAHLCEIWVADHPGVQIERKALTLVLHLYDAPHFVGPAHAFAEETCRLLPNFAPQSGRGTIEFKPAGSDKGHGIRRLMTQAPFSGRRPVFIGDDLPDEPGFTAVETFGGVSIRVGDGPTSAMYRLPHARAVHAWLRTLAD